MNRWWHSILVGLVVAGICGLIWAGGMRVGWENPTLSPSGPVETSVAGSDQAVGNQVAGDQVDPTELYRLINTWRIENKLSPLKPDKRLEQSARTKLDLMLSQAKFDHLDQNNQPNWSFLTQANYDYQLAGENLAFSGGSAWQVFSAWSQSASHSAQLLKPEYMDMGVALFCPVLPSVTTQPMACTVVLHLAREK